MGFELNNIPAANHCPFPAVPADFNGISHY